MVSTALPKSRSVPGTGGQVCPVGSPSGEGRRIRFDYLVVTRRNLDDRVKVYIRQNYAVTILYDRYTCVRTDLFPVHEPRQHHSGMEYLIGCDRRLVRLIEWLGPETSDVPPATLVPPGGEPINRQDFAANAKLLY